MVCRSSFRYKLKIKFWHRYSYESEADAKEKIANIEAEINAFVG